ncbi:MAG: response regulator [Rhizomicrobium sp.]
MMHFASRSDPARILCVEEDVVQRKLLQACLDVAGADALFAAGATQALTLFRRNHLDLVLMDFDLHAAAELAAFEIMRYDGHVPILAVTDNECRWTEEDYREAGFTGLYVKPIEPSRLIAAMDGAMRLAGRAPLLSDPQGRFEDRAAYFH